MRNTNFCRFPCTSGVTKWLHTRDPYRARVIITRKRKTSSAPVRQHSRRHRQQHPPLPRRHRSEWRRMHCLRIDAFDTSGQLLPYGFAIAITTSVIQPTSPRCNPSPRRRRHTPYTTAATRTVWPHSHAATIVTVAKLTNAAASPTSASDSPTSATATSTVRRTRGQRHKRHQHQCC